MTTRSIARLIFALAALAAGGVSARADVQVCSRMSYVVEVAVALEDKGAAATRGWYRIDPAQCRTVIQGNSGSEQVYLHVRALPVYGGSRLPQGGHADFCVTSDSFTLPAAQTCNRAGYRMARFTASPSFPSRNQPEEPLPISTCHQDWLYAQKRFTGKGKLSVIARRHRGISICRV